MKIETSHAVLLVFALSCLGAESYMNQREMFAPKTCFNQSDATPYIVKADTDTVSHSFIFLFK